MSIEIGKCLSRSQMNTFNRYKKSANQRRNERIRNKRKQIPPEQRMFEWVALSVDPQNNERGDLSSQPKFKIKSRKWEIDEINYFSIHNNQHIRYEKESTWLNYKWKQKWEN